MMNSGLKIIRLVFITLLMPFFLAVPVWAAIGYVDPDGDISVFWQSIPAGTNFSCIDEINGDQGNLDTADDVHTGVNSEIDEYNMETLTGVLSVSEIKIWIYGYVSDSEDDIKVAISKDGSTWEDYKYPEMGISSGWHSAAFSMTWDQTDLNGLRVRLKADLWEEEVRAYAMYAEVTYTTLSPPPLQIKGGVNIRSGVTIRY